jgi:hypothetical protein
LNAFDDDERTRADATDGVDGVDASCLLSGWITPRGVVEK